MGLPSLLHPFGRSLKMPRFLRVRASSVLGFALASVFCGLGFLRLIANLEQ
jgi:hypothetical protein